MPAPANTQAPSVVTGNQAGLMQAIASGLPQQSQAAVNAQLAVLAKKMGNKRYIRESLIKMASSLTNGSKTQTYATGTPFTFNLPQPNNAYCRGIIVRTVLNYTIGDADGDATFALTQGGALAIYDNIEVRYNKSQIKIRPYHLRCLAIAGALDQLAIGPQVASTDSGNAEDDQLADYLTEGMAVGIAANVLKSDIWLPFNILSADEDRGLLPSMPGETGVQVICTTPASLLGPDPYQNAITNTDVEQDGTLVVATTSTVQVIAVYSDGECYAMPMGLPYDMSVLNGTIQMQIDNPQTNLIAGAANVNRGKLNILGQHQYVILLVVDGAQSVTGVTAGNIVYLESSKDDVGANVFWKYGTGSNLDIQEFYHKERITHGNRDMDSEGVIFMVQAPLIGQRCPYYRDGTQYLDNTTAGWPAWHWGISLTTVTTTTVNNNAAVINARIEPFTIYVNPVGLTPV